MTTLLAVDDSSTMRKVLDITFAGEDFTTVLAGNAQEALACLEQSQAPIALVDITLGPDSGYDLCQQIKTAAPGTKVLLLSSKQNPYDVARGSSVGADDHLDKPFDTQILIDKVRSLAAAAKSQPAPAPVAPRPMAAPAPFPAQVRLPPRPTASKPEPAREEVSSVGPSPAPAYARPAQDTLQPAARRAESSRPPATSQPPATSTQATNGAGFESRLAGLGLTADQVQGVLALSREVVEQAVWEVVPVLAEVLIREEIQKLTRA